MAVWVKNSNIQSLYLATDPWTLASSSSAEEPLLKAKRGIRVCLLVFVVLSVLSLYYPLEAYAQDDYYHEDFKWSYKGIEWTWSLDIPKALYDSYRSVPVSTRTRNGLAGYGFLTTTNDYYLKMVADKLEEATAQKNYEPYDQVSFVLAFVQSLPYTSDSVSSGFDEYPRFPLETLVDNGGDCEDTSILFATLTLIIGYGAVYINPPEHYAVGVLGDNLEGSYYTYNDKTYYYCETTGDGWEIGEIPSEFKDEKAYIYEINPYQQYVPDIEIITPAPSASPEIPEFPSSLILTVFVLTVTAGILVFKRRQSVYRRF
jgi:hypothetical protein